MDFNKSQISAAAAWLGLPAGLALSSSLGGAAGHFAAPSLWSLASKIPFFHPTPEAVAGLAVGTASVVAPLALLPMVRMLQKAESLPRWASAPVGLSMALAGIGHYVLSVRTLLLSGVAPLPMAINQAGFAAILGAMVAMMAGAVVASPPRAKPGSKKT
ncbi:MAG TPA: hypothetical protein VK558_02390, partial [Patescibacteria group bacterium]|nr:hypothetical protein [Patescibacteria group bacterium]